MQKKREPPKRPPSVRDVLLPLTFYHREGGSAMNNEELAARIRAGDREQLPRLWAQVERFVAKQARRRMVVTDGFGGVEFDDLYNSGYVALVAAVDSFDPDAGRTFVSWLALHLKTAFAQSGGCLTRKQAKDPLHRAGSLDVPVGQDEAGATLGELIEDPASLAGFERAEDRQYRAQLHAALAAAMGQLQAHYRDVIQRRFYRGQTFSAIAADIGVSPELVRRWEGEALGRLRHPRISRPLRRYLPGRDYHV